MAAMRIAAIPLFSVISIPSKSTAIELDASESSSASLSINESSASDSSSSSSSSAVSKIINNLKSDEILVTFNATSLGLGLTEIEYQNKKRIIVNRINADVMNPYLQSLVTKGMIIVAVNGDNIEGMSLKEFSQYINTFPRPILITLRDPNRFFQLLHRRNNRYYDRISTLILPKNRYSQQNEESLSIELFLNPEIGPEQLRNLTTSKKGDVLEILYQIQVLTRPNGRNSFDRKVSSEVVKVLDGIKNHTMLEPGFANVKRLYEESLFLLLGSTKRGNRYTSFKNNNIENEFDGGLLNYLPLQWDNLLVGMGVGDERKLYLPSSYCKQKQFNNLIANSQIIVDVKLMSINGLSA